MADSPSSILRACAELATDSDIDALLELANAIDAHNARRVCSRCRALILDEGGMASYNVTTGRHSDLCAACTEARP